MVDTNVLMAASTVSPSNQLAWDVRERDPARAAPQLWQSEFRNAVLGTFRRDLMRLPHAVEAFELAQLILDRREFRVDTARVLAAAAANALP